MGGLLAWRDEPDVLLVRFEDVMGDDGPVTQRRALDAIALHCGLPAPEDSVALFKQPVVGKPTKTWSGERSDPRRYWDARVEAQFMELGGECLAQELGYSLGSHLYQHAAD
jgi:hypothetical protein